ncbi:MAG: hypothetical protein KDJ52_00255 [Anaerolineae bacterium]|nr:hypothetical protein [Anaerolineae bacterium]
MSTTFTITITGETNLNKKDAEQELRYFLTKAWALALPTTLALDTPMEAHIFTKTDQVVKKVCISIGGRTHGQADR